MELAKLGGLPMITRDWSEDRFDWIDLLAKLRRDLFVGNIIDVWIEQDHLNVSKHSLYVSFTNIYTSIFRI